MDAVEFRCQDLREDGVVLISTASPRYQSLRADIQRAAPAISKDPIGAILLNRSEKTIAAWSLRYRTEELSGHMGGSNHVIGAHMVLPFGMSEETRPIMNYWNTILPGSKRYVSGGEMLGDNTDVRPPRLEEVWKGSSFGFSSDDGLSGRLDKIKVITLILDGIFFSDGECIGPNELQLFESVVYEAEVYQQAAATAWERVRRGADTIDVLDAVENFTGPSRTAIPLPPGRKSDPEAFRELARASVAWRISSTRKSQGDDQAVSMLVEWAAVELPKYRRR